MNFPRKGIWVKILKYLKPALELAFILIITKNRDILKIDYKSVRCDN